MPELPEIETIRRDLEMSIQGDRSTRVDVFDDRLMKKKEALRWNTVLAGQRWQSFGRRGKYLFAHLNNGWRAGFHMRMTGQLIVTPAPLPLGEGGRRPSEAKPRMLIHFASGKTLGLYDQRRFAEAWLLAPGQAWHSSALPGPDALNELKLDHFITLVKGRTTRIQPLLMDQRLIAGVGNIYAQEALFKAAIRPTRPGNRITLLEASRLYETLRETLHTAITYRGSSSRNYRDANGDQGAAQTLHAVYRKGGNPCPRCGTRLRSARVGGRGTVFCPQCQK
jgi:formamidopyrimidine-DNA glycosylase